MQTGALKVRRQKGGKRKNSELEVKNYERRKGGFAGTHENVRSGHYQDVFCTPEKYGCADSRATGAAVGYVCWRKVSPAVSSLKPCRIHRKMRRLLACKSKRPRIGSNCSSKPISFRSTKLALCVANAMS